MAAIDRGLTSPDQLRRRRLSVRSFDAEHLLVGAELTDGDAVAEVARRMFADSRVTYLHVHNAAPGCFAVRMERAQTRGPGRFANLTGAAMIEE